MKVFIVDDCNWLSKSLESRASEIRNAGNSLKIYSLPDGSCLESQCIDEFFLRVWEAKSWVDSNPGFAGGKKSLRELTENDKDGETIFLVGLNAKLSGLSFRQDQDGVELLKHIRLTEELGALRNAHVVLYSFETVGALLSRKPGNLMALSAGTTLLRLPEGMEKMLDPEWLRNAALRKANLSQDYFTPFVACAYRQPDTAHTYSNWWGMQQFILARRELMRKPKISMPHKVKEELLKLENKKVRFLNQVASGGGDGKPPEVALDYPDKHKIFKVVYLDDEQDWQKIVKEALEEDFKSSDTNKVKVKTPPLPAKGITREWLEQELLLGSDDEPDLVLLDLRMRGSAEANTPVEQTSGAMAASIVREISPGLPIILMTASNKAWTFEAAMKLGIDGYWMKEGIGEHLPPGTSVDNYGKLLRLISTALGEEYQFLREFTNDIRKLSEDISNDIPWWRSYQWNDGKKTEVDCNEVFSKLWNIQILYHEFLRSTLLLGAGIGEKQHGETLFLGMVAEIRGVIELIHGDWTGGFNSLLAQRQDAAAGSIYKLCCEMVHNRQDGQRRETANEVLTLFLGYLSTSPQFWQEMNQTYLKGSRVNGKIVEFYNYGAMVELENGLSGLLRNSEISWTDTKATALGNFSIGMAVTVVVKQRYRDNEGEQKFIFSYRDTQPNPWENILEVLPVGACTRGCVVSRDNSETLVRLDNGCIATLHNTLLHKGQIPPVESHLDVVISAVYPWARKITLSLPE